jgi:glycosyltransferase involved in cell wall biosynthesis
MKILHIGDICGVPQLISEEQRRRGLDSQSISYPPDYSLVGRLKKFNDLFKIIKNFNIIHFHYSTGLPYGLDLPIWKLLNKKIIMHYHGRIRRLGLPILHRFFVDKFYVSTPDLLKYAPKDAIYIPNPIKLEKVHKKSRSNPLKFIHLPTNRKVKGTKYIIKAFEELKMMGYEFEFKIIEGKSHSEAISAIKEADVVIDQLHCGWYGLVSIEAWMLNKPVICYIRPDLYFKYDVPVNPAGTTTIKDAIKEFITWPEICELWGNRGRKYVERNHDIEKMQLED